MSRNRENLVKRLVDRKMASGSRGKSGCVPCFGQIMCNTCVGLATGPKGVSSVSASRSNNGN